MIEPKFKSAIDYEKTQILMQPIFIRLIDNLRKESELQQWEVKYQEINIPFPGYEVTLKKDSNIIIKNLWELCFEISFNNYQKDSEITVTIDENLIDNSGELDWVAIDTKTKNLVINLLTINN